jgi:hypothetical protein
LKFFGKTNPLETEERGFEDVDEELEMVAATTVKSDPSASNAAT